MRIFVAEMNPRNILVLTGTRAEYGLLRPVMDAILAHPDLELQLLVTGMHLETEFGRTVELIEADGYPIAARVPLHSDTDNGRGMAESVARGISGIAQELERLSPDVLLLLGDRTEVLAGASAALFMGIPIAHIHGGDVSRGGTDESVRHAVTKMAHLHFPATEAAARRIRLMGEDNWRIHTSGAPGLDTILQFDPLGAEEMKARYGLEPGDDYLMLVQHPVSTEPELAGAHIREVLAALDEFDLPVVAIFPNSDAGYSEILRAYSDRLGKAGFRCFRNLPHEHYLSLLKHCSALIGNSSSGIIESASFRIPVVNVGIRQEGRDRSENVLDASPVSTEVRNTLEKALSPEFKKVLEGVENAYGEGEAGKRIAQILSSVPLDKRLIQKKLNYT